MHAIIESRPGDDPALYLLGNEQQVQETTEYLANLAEGARLSGFQTPSSESQTEDSAIIDSLQTALIDPFREPNKLPGDSGAFALSMLNPTERARYDNGYVEALTRRIDSEAITFEDAEERITRFEAIKPDFTVLDENGYESAVTDGRIEPFARTIIWANNREEFLEATRYEVFESDEIDADTTLGVKGDEALTILNAAVEAVPPISAEAAFSNVKERELAQSVGATAFTKQFDIKWSGNGTPSVGLEQPHIMLWKEGEDPRVPLDPVATILSPDHPVRANPPSTPPAIIQ